MKVVHAVCFAAALTMVLALAACDAERGQAPSSPSPAAASRAGGASAASLAAVLGNPDAYARARGLGELLPTLGPEAVPEATKALRKFQFEMGATEFELLTRFWASQQPAEATAWAFHRAPPLYRESAVRTAVEVWAAADPRAVVMALAAELRKGLDAELAQIAKAALVHGWFKVDRPGLEEYIQGLGVGIERQRALFHYMLALISAEGSEAAIHWAEAVPEQDERWKLAAYRQAMAALAWTDMDAARRFCDAHCDGPKGKGLRNVLIRSRLNAGEDGGEVVEWVARAPEQTDEQRANKQHSLWVAFATWAYRDRQAALDWMKHKVAQEHPEPWLHVLYGEYARQIAAESPADAIPWAEKIEDATDREHTLVRIARAWKLKDDAAAEAWLDHSPLSEQARAQARNTRAPNYLPKQ